MKLVFLSKWPPFVGGETTKAYFMIKELSRFHKIDVISCGWDIKENERCEIDVKDLEYIHPPNGRLYSSVLFNKLNTIPKYNPLTEKLVSIFLDHVEYEDVDGIIAWYLLPFGSAALVIKQLVGVDYVFQHAGSDMQRILFGNRILQPLGFEIIKHAKALLAYPNLFNFLNSLFKNQPVFKSFHKYLLDPAFFRISTRKSIKNLERYLSQSRVDTIEKFLAENKIVFRPGKLSRFTGVKEVLRLSEKMRDVLFLLTGADTIGIKKLILKYETKNKNIIYAGAAPIWLMPSLYSISSLVLHLEVNFPVRTHRSLIPLESQLSETPVITNTETEILFPQLVVKTTLNINIVKKEIKKFLASDIKVEKQKENLKKFIQERDEYIHKLNSFLIECFKNK